MFMGKTTDAAYKAAIGNDYHRARLGIALDMLRRHSAPGQAFDFGCGEGAFMRLLTAEGWRVAGCDPSPDLCPDDAIVGDVAILENLDPASLDLIVSLNVWSYMPGDEERRFWPAARHALRPSGLLLMCNPNGLATAPRYAQNTDALQFPAYLAERGFSELEQDFFRTYPPIWRRLLGDRARIIDRKRLASLSPDFKRRRSTGYFSISIKTP